MSRRTVTIWFLILWGIACTLFVTAGFAENLSFRFYRQAFILNDEGLIESPGFRTAIPLRYNSLYPADLLRERVSDFAEREPEPGDMWEDLFSDALVISDTSRAESTLFRFEGPAVSIFSDDLTGGLEVIDCRIEDDDILLILEREDKTHFLRIIEWENNDYCFTDSADLPDFVRIASRWSGTSLGDLRWKEEQYYISLCKDPEIGWRISMIDEKAIEPLFLWDQEGVIFHGNFLFCDHDLMIPITEVDFESYRQKVIDAFSAADSSRWMTVTQEDLQMIPVYAEPSEDSDILCELFAKRPVYAEEFNDGWVHIRLGAVVTGYIPGRNVEPQRDENYAGLPSDYINQDIKSGANIYAAADTSSSILGETGDMKTWLIGIYSDEEWYLVMTRDGQFGYLQCSDTIPGNG